jgi:hypothetical protein
MLLITLTVSKGIQALITSQGQGVEQQHCTSNPIAIDLLRGPTCSQRAGNDEIQLEHLLMDASSHPEWWHCAAKSGSYEDDDDLMMQQAKQSKAKQSKAKQSKAKQSKAKQSKAQRQREARHSVLNSSQMYRSQTKHSANGYGVSTTARHE